MLTTIEEAKTSQSTITTRDTRIIKKECTHAFSLTGTYCIQYKEERLSVEFFKVLNFVISFCPMSFTGKTLMKCFAKIRSGAGVNSLAQIFSPYLQETIQ